MHFPFHLFWIRDIVIVCNSEPKMNIKRELDVFNKHIWTLLSRKEKSQKIVFALQHLVLGIYRMALSN